MPSRAVEQPYRWRAARKFPGAPPGWAARVGYPALSEDLWAKSMSSSPKAITSVMESFPFLDFYPIIAWFPPNYNWVFALSLNSRRASR